MERIHVCLTEDQRTKLRMLARRTGRTQSELIRDAIDAYLVRFTPRLRREVLRKCRGIWRDRDPSEFRATREEVERKRAR